MNLSIADVFDTMRGKTIDPCGQRECVGETPAIEQDLAFAIAANEMAESDSVVDGGPAVGVDWNGIAHGNSCVEHAHAFILQYQLVMLRRCDNSVEFGRPGPGLSHDLLSAPALTGTAGSSARSPARQHGGIVSLRFCAIYHPREGGSLADVFQAAHPRDETFDTHAEAGVRNAAVLTQIQVPLECLARQLVVL
jgi:hypothetical protein